MTIALLSGSFGGTGQSTSIELKGQFNLTISGTFTATVALQRSFDAGSSWHTLSRDSAGNAASYTAPCSMIAEEIEDGVLYRLNCTAYTSGTAAYRISR